MRPDETLVAQPIRSLQTMLRVLSEDNGIHPTVIPDGIYGQQTQRAVSVFQQLHGLPVTGVTDLDTWEMIVKEYEPALIRVDMAQPLQITMNPGERYRKGSDHPNIYIFQSVLTVLSNAYDGISPPSRSGILDEATAASVASFQQMSGLEQTGDVDKITWKQMSIHYPMAAQLIAEGQRI